MKVTFWFLFIYLAVAVVFQILFGVPHYLLIGVLDVLFATVAILSGTKLSMLQNVIIIVLFAVWFRSTTALDWITDIIFYILMVISLVYFSSDRQRFKA